MTRDDFLRLRHDIERLEAMTTEEAMDAFNLDDEAGRQDLLEDMREELAYEEAKNEEQDEPSVGYDLDDLCPRLSGQYAVSR